MNEQLSMFVELEPHAPRHGQCLFVLGEWTSKCFICEEERQEDRARTAVIKAIMEE